MNRLLPLRTERLCEAKDDRTQLRQRITALDRQLEDLAARNERQAEDVRNKDARIVELRQRAEDLRAARKNHSPKEEQIPMKYNTRRSHHTQAFSPIKTEKRPTGHTYEGGAGYVRDTRSELFLLTVSQLAGEGTFYESGEIRQERFTKLISELMRQQDFDWLYDLFVWTRTHGNLRTVALVGAVVTAHERLWMWSELPEAQHTNRELIRDVCQRADEPGEILAIWTALYGRNIPKPVKRGVADAANRLYSERSYLKYNSASNAFRFADVLQLCHPTPRAGQGSLYHYILDSRFNDNDPGSGLPMLQARKDLGRVPMELRRGYLHAPDMAAAGMTWESAAGWLQGGMDAEAWEALIPQMGIFARLRNLRNFDQAGVSDKAARPVMDQLADPDEIAKSRLLPMRFLSAYKNAPSLRWAWPLEQGLNYSLDNIPELDGNTLILVDRSGSMFWAELSRNSNLTRADAAAIFGVGLAKRCANATLVQFGNDSELVDFHGSGSVLPMIRGFKSMGGTHTVEAINERRSSAHTRVVVITDEQYHSPVTGGSSNVDDAVPKDVPLHTINLAGYKYGHSSSGGGNRFTYGGLTDQMFKLIPIVESGRDGHWPWEH